MPEQGTQARRSATRQAGRKIRARLPIRPREQVLEDESYDFLKAVLPKEWIARPVARDYGLDVRVEIVNDVDVTGANFSIQLKATDHLSVSRDGTYISHPCETSALLYFLQQSEPVLYVLLDARRQVGYWLWVQDYLRDVAPIDWRTRYRLTLRIPTANRFDKAVLDQIKQRTVTSHERARLLLAVDMAHNPYYRLGVEFAEGSFQIGVSPRYPGAEHDCPFMVGGRFHFDASPEGVAGRLELERHIRTGAAVQIAPRFVEGFEPPQLIRDLFPLVEEWRIEEIVLGANNSGLRFPARLQALDRNRSVIGELPYILLRETRAGTEEITLASEPQANGPRREITLRIGRTSTTAHMRQEMEGENVGHLRDFLRFQAALAHASYLRLTNLDNQLSIEGRTDGTVAEPDAESLDLIEDLAFLQERFNRELRWPGEYSPALQRLVRSLVTIVRTGKRVEYPATIGFTLPKSGAARLAERCDGQEWFMLAFESQQATAPLLGHELSLGPSRLILAEAKLTKASERRLKRLSSLPAEAEVRLEVEVGSAGAATTYSEWLATEQAPLVSEGSGEN